MQKGNLSAKTIWGKVVLFLKEHHQVALHVACGDITDVQVNEHYLVINTQDSMLNNLLADGRREIESALRWQGLDLEIYVNYTPKEKSVQERDIEKLIGLVGEYLIIK